MTLHIDLRPNSLDGFVGNISLKKSLQTLLESDKMPRTFLFTGPSGCGKTTLARIIATYLNVSEYDLCKVNSSNDRGIDKARSIIESCKYKPLQGPYKVFILDEVHKATNEFQNAMLDILEEPPSYVVFILCTTDPQKLLETVKTRCTPFQVQKVKKKTISNYLQVVIEKQELNIIKEGPDLISKSCNGSLRNALVYLNMIQDVTKLESVEKLLEKDVNEKAQILELCQALSKERNGV